MGGWDKFPSDDGLDKAEMEEKIENKIDKINWDTIRPSNFRSISAEICENLIIIKEADITSFGYINQAIKII